MDSFKWQCRKCKTLYPEDESGLILGTNPSGMKLYSCPCGGIVDLVAAQKQTPEEVSEQREEIKS